MSGLVPNVVDREAVYLASMLQWARLIVTRGADLGFERYDVFGLPCSFVRHEARILRDNLARTRRWTTSKGDFPHWLQRDCLAGCSPF